MEIEEKKSYMYRRIWRQNNNNNNKSQVRCPRLPFTLWIYEEKKSKVPYRNQIASNPRLGNALESWCTTVQHHAVESGHHRRRLFERNPLSAWQKPFRKSRKLSGTGWIIAEELWSEMRRSVLHSWAKKNLLIASNPRNKNFKCCRNCVCRWLRC